MVLYIIYCLKKNACSTALCTMAEFQTTNFVCCLSEKKYHVLVTVTGDTGLVHFSKHFCQTLEL